MLYPRSNLLVTLSKIHPAESSCIMTVVTPEELSVFRENYTSSCHSDVIGAVVASGRSVTFIAKPELETLEVRIFRICLFIREGLGKGSCIVGSVVNKASALGSLGVNTGKNPH